MSSIILEMNLVSDVSEEYIKLRKNGLDRKSAVDQIIESYFREMNDIEDSAQVWIGLAKATGGKNELTTELLEKADHGFDDFEKIHPELITQLQTLRKKYCNEKLIGLEAKYSQEKKKPWQCGWLKNGLYYHLMHGEYPTRFGLDNWYALLYKKTEIEDGLGKTKHIFYVSVSEKIPSSEEDVAKLEWLCHKDMGRKVYTVELDAGSAKEERKYDLIYLGSFDNITLPEDEECYAKDRGYPIPSILVYPDNVPALEVFACLNYSNRLVTHRRQ